VSTARDVIVFALHDADCPDTKCDPMVMGKYYRQADRLAAAGFVVIRPTDPEVIERAIVALAHLVALKDGPRDDNYRASKEFAWADARAVLAALGEPEGKESDRG